MDFEEYLKEQCVKEGGFDGVLDDDYEDAYKRWIGLKEAGDIIEYANSFFKSTDN